MAALVQFAMEMNATVCPDEEESEGIYDGEFNVEGRAEGHGVYKYLDGTCYNGEWRDGKREGRGTAERKADGNMYTGEWRQNRWHGHGTCRYSGAYYCGQFSHDMKWGRGTCRFKDGDQYTGEWKNDMQHGLGVYIYAGGKVEIGTYENHRDVGDGVSWSADRQQAWRLRDGAEVGEISPVEAKVLAHKIGLPVPALGENGNDQRIVIAQQIDRFLDAKESRYDGELTYDGKADGQGVYAYADGTIYKGQWQDGKRHGQGIAERPKDNYRYIGQWQDGKREGHGECLYMGANYVGDWHNDKKEGRGTCTFRDGDAYTGDWKDGLQHGIGLYTYANGVAELGHYLNHKDTGDGVRWSADRQQAHRLVNGEKEGDISLKEAELMAARMGHPVPLAITDQSAQSPRDNRLAT